VICLVFVVAAGTAATEPAAAVPGPPTDAGEGTDAEVVPADDPFPIRRVRGTDARLPDLLKELDPGPVVRLPRAEFEARARAAGRAVARAKQVARVVDATYHATLDGSDLTGTAELGILNAHGVTGFVPLDPLRLAVRGAKWADGGTAVLAVPSGAPAPAVWVDRDGRRVLQLNWSLAGTTEPGERRFELRLPPCPTSVLELDLPADQVPAASADVLLTGPFDVPGQPARRAWRMRFGGRSRVEFAVRAGGPTGTAARGKLFATYELTPGQLAAAFEYELHPVRGSVGEWTFTVDPGLRITDVVTNNRAGWTVDPPAAPNGPRRLRVSLRQPGPGGKVLVSAVAPFPDPSRPDGPLPVVRPLDTVLDDEKLELRLAPGLKPDSWAPGDYRLTDATAPAPTALDQTRVLALTGALLPPGTDEPFRRMPTVHTTASGAEFAALERLDWNIDTARSVLVARVGLRVRRGPLFQITVRPPAGFTFERGASGSDELVSHVGPAAPAGQVVEFARPLASGQRVEVRLEFRGPGARPGEPVPFPVLAVVGAAERDGWLNVTTGPEWTATAEPGAGALPAGLWGWLTTDAPAGAWLLYLFRGREPDGTVTLARARPSASAEVRMMLDAPGAEWVVATRFTLTVTGGALPTATVFVPGAARPRSWKLLDDTNALAEAVPLSGERLAPFPLIEPVARVYAGGTLWVLRFARPVSGRVVIETTATGPPTSDRAVSLPVPRLVGIAQALRAEAAPALADRVVIVQKGDSLVPVIRRAGGPLPVRAAYLVTVIRGPGEALAAFGGTVHNSSGGTVRVLLPAGAEVRGACVAGRWLNPASCATRTEDGALPVPVPAGAAVRFEVRYRVPVPTSWPTRRVNSPVPTTDGVTEPVKQWWVFADGMLPGWPARPWDATADVPPLLGGPLTGGAAPALVTQSNDEWVRAGSARTADALAVVLTAAWVVVGVIAARRRRGRGAAVLMAAVVVGLFVTELGPPWWARAAWPPLCASTLALALVLARLALRRREELVAPAAPVPAPAAPALVAPAVVVLAAAGLLGFIVCARAAVAQSVPTVLVLTGAEGREEVVAARELVDRLDALAKPQPPPAIVTSAEYDARVEETGARVTAKFVVQAFRPGDNAVSLPLSDIRLERATVDGAPAFPTAPRPDAYSVAVGGPGRHEIELRFAVTVAANGPEREVKFGVPEVPAAKLAASLPGAARQPAAVGRVGRQVVSTAGDRATVEADLGGARAVHLRWREGAGGAAAVKVREGCVWDVTDTGASLTAAYLVRVERGTIGSFRVEVPAELEVLRVAVRNIDTVGAVPLRDWSLAPEKGGFGLLRIDLQTPTAGRFVAVVECAPRKPITRQPVLRFPRVSLGAVTGEVESVYGLRSARVTVDGVGLVGVIDFPPDALKDFTAVADLKLDATVPVRAFRPAPGATAELRPALHVGEPPTVRTVTAWHLGPQRADASGTLAWTAKEALPLVEFFLPGVKVLEVRGPDVAAWSQAGTRVQVWVKGGAREGSLEWSGTTTPAPAGKPGEPVAFDPAHPKVSGARVGSDEVRVRPVAGWTVRQDRSRGWHAAVDSAGALQFRTDLQTVPALRVQLAPLPPAGK
jgi:hypothetical protein